MKIRAIKAKAPNVGKMRLTLLNELRSIGSDIEKDFRATVATWDRKPEFNVDISLAGGTPSVEVTTDDEVYKYLDEGTRAHFVAPVNAKALAFSPNYTAKTSPGVLGSRGGGATGGVVFSKGHMVSGIEARHFSEKIIKKWRGTFGKRMAQAMAAAAIATGHGKG